MDKELKKEDEVVFVKPKSRWRSFFYIDPKDKWNWILGALAVFLLWWGVKTIIHSLKVG